VAVVAALGCAAPSAPSTERRDQAPGADRPAEPSRTLVLTTRVEVNSLSHAPFWQRRFIFLSTPRLFNANLALPDEKGVSHPYLAEALPQLNTDTWRVLPDGRMETTYRLRANLTWQDGTPLSAEDFVFAWRVLTTPDLGAATSQPHGLMEQVAAPDPRTVAIQWRQLYPEGGALPETFTPLPRHLLQQAFEQGPPDVFLGHPYWTRDYVSLGPYQVDRWEPGTFMEGAAFPGHALGRPKIERIKVMFMGDPNTVMANLLAQGVHIAIEGSIRHEQGLVLQREWVPTGAGKVLLWPAVWRAVAPQLRPELASPRTLADLRVRKALAHGLDKQLMNESILEGQGAVVDSMISPLMDYYPDVDRALTRHPYDVRRAEQLLNEAGYTRGSDGVFARSGERFSVEIAVLTGTQQGQELAIMGTTYRQLGLDVQERVIPAVQAQDNQLISTLPGVFAGGAASGERNLAVYHTRGIPRAENRWQGRNYGGWSNPTYDRMVDTFLTTLPRAERVQQIIQMAKLMSDELPVFPYYFSPDGIAFAAGLTGPGTVVPEVPTTWNVHVWELR
jgi:peptide/nickel transport system substrate-binding protein